MSGALTIDGGAYGVQADLEELARLASQFTATAAELAEVAAHTGAIGAHPSFLLTSALDPVGSTTVVAVLIGAVSRLTASIAGLVALADGVSAAAVAYRLSDLQVSDVVFAVWQEVPASVAAFAVVGVVGTGMAWVGGRVLTRVGLDAPGAVLAIATGANPGEIVAASRGRLQRDLAGDGAAVVEWMVRHPDAARGVLATVPHTLQHFLPDDPRPGATSSQMAGFSALLVATGRPLGLFVERPVKVTGIQTVVRAGPTGIRDLTSRLTPLTGPRGSLVGYEPNRAGVIVDRVASPKGGPPRWIVYLPPTSDWGVTGGKYPSDLTSNVAMVSKQGIRTEQHPDAVDQALTAMRRAGIRPGEPVMLVGFSQGGITAASLASDPQVRSEYQVDAMLTAGSPISEFALDDDIAVLSLENDADLIPELDGATNPDQPNWVTVNADVLDDRHGDALTRDRVDGDEPFAGHYLDGYLRTAGRVDASTDPSVQAWRERVAPFLTGDNVTTTEITVEREQ